MNRIVILFVAIFVGNTQIAQENRRILPKGHSFELESEPLPIDVRSSSGSAIYSPPDFEVRTMAEWEEIQSLIITWAGFEHILKQIAFHAKEECEVIIVADSETEVHNYLNGNNEGGAPFDNLDNITVIEAGFNSIWGRDYGAHTIYREDVEELLLVDWIYNRNRPADDQVPVSIAEEKQLPLYVTSQAPYDLMATGGNFMSDGMGTAFSSELIFEENEGGTTWWGAPFPDHSGAEIDGILEDFMGIDTYIKMDVLPYDGIHHIDIHMKLLDEETIIMGEYPSGVADGPQIEANLQYVLDNFQSPWGTPYDIVRVQMPPESGDYPDTDGAYRTYTNMVFVNKTVLVPTYEAAYDQAALDVIQAELPGYNVVGIECNDIIQLSGAIHCITKAVGVSEPLLINHNHLEDTYNDETPYAFSAIIKHAEGVSDAIAQYRVDGGDYQTVTMSYTGGNDIWSGQIPAQSVGSVIDYYIQATANTGQQQVRPLVAPEGYWTFEVLDSSVGIEEFSQSPIQSVYPNPASAITLLHLNMPSQENIDLSLQDMLGREVLRIYTGEVGIGEQRFYLDASRVNPGMYQVVLAVEGQRYSQALMVR